MERQERRERKILTENRMITVRRRETSFEGLAEQFESGEDGLYALMTEDKNMIFRPKVEITKKDVEEVPGLREWREGIERWKTLQKEAKGYAAFIIKRTIIEMRQDQYIIKDSFRCPIQFTQLTHSMRKPIELPWNEWIDDNGKICYSGLSFLDPKTISAILANYVKLSSNPKPKFDGDTWYMIQDFTGLMERALEPYPMYRRFVELKFCGYQNSEIKDVLEQEYNFKHTIEYISNVWCKKIPKVISQKAQDEWLIWHYTQEEYGKWKKCTRCGQIKLAHPRFFSLNKSAKSGFYSICKECRRSKKKSEKKG